MYLMGLWGLWGFIGLCWYCICSLSIYRSSIYRQSIYNVVNRTYVNKIIILVITCLNKSININQIVRYLYLFKQIQNKYTHCTHKLQKLWKCNSLILQGFLRDGDGWWGGFTFQIKPSFVKMPLSIPSTPRLQIPKINCTKISHNSKNHFGI